MNNSRRDFLKTIPFIASPMALAVSASISSEGQSKNVFAHWACDLNEWKWPKEWGEPPERLRIKLRLCGRLRYQECKEEFHEIREFCERMAGGRREVLRVHNVERIKSMTAEQFEEWADAGFSIEAHNKIHAQRKFHFSREYAVSLNERFSWTRNTES